MITWEDFGKIDLRAGTIVRAEYFPEAHKPAYKLWVNLGEEVGIKQSSAQITELYSLDELMGRQVLCVINFPPRQIGPFMSEILVTGVADATGRIILSSFERPVPNGSRLH